MASTDPQTAQRLDEERQRTDEKLQDERVKVDGLLAAVDGVEEERAEAQEALEVDRERVDEALEEVPGAYERTVVEAVAAERERADDSIAVERKHLDEVLRLERERDAAAGRALAREREETDRSLDDERQATDETIQAHADRLAIVSHDLKNPLQAIVSSVTALDQLAGTLEDPQQAAYVRMASTRIERAARAMDALIGDLLTSASLELGELPMKAAPHDVGPLLGDVLRTLEPTAATKRLRLRTRCSPVLRALFDPGRLFQVLSNVIGNAIKFTPPGGKVEVVVEPSGPDVRFTVLDGGPGIPEADRERVFERHFRGTESRDGLGLGLFIARSIVEAHQGRIWCEARTDGPGMAFHFTLPRPPG